MSYQWYQVDGKWRWHSTQRTADHRPTPCPSGPLQPTRPVAQASWGCESTDRSSTTRTTRPARCSLCRLVRRPATSRRRPTRCAWRATRRTTRRARMHACASRPPFAGEAMIAIATDRIVSHPARERTGRRHDLEVPVTAEWGARRLCAGHGLAAARRRPPIARRPAPSALVWLGWSPALRTLGMQNDAPGEGDAAPAHRGPSRSAISRGEEAFVTLAAVDEGILRLTKFKCPDRSTGTSASAARASTCATTTAACSTPTWALRHVNFGADRSADEGLDHHADPHRRPGQRAGEARRQGPGQDRAGYPRLHRRAAG